ncbi:major facilitator superfamily MFS-1 domain containing protein [Elysia marginata]|uniref:Major facilitator superfamily MFS-1 domain containing protein n=1 Tax=Elysia marginata TaxID=1093978 RepID=A0AAV4H8S5_9GAST|nr:major facilitator superfamily MFS-1 domain containing protein [Elysia marginata]
MVPEEDRQRGTGDFQATTATSTVYPKHEPINANQVGSDKEASILTTPCRNGKTVAITTQFNGSIPEDTASSRSQKSSSSSEDATPTFLKTLLSWRVVVYILLHISFVTLNLPRTSVNMAIVCINTKREEVLSMANESGLAGNGIDEILSDGIVSAETYNRSDESISSNAYNESRVLRESYNSIINDINWDSSTVGLILSGQLFLSCLGPVLFDTLRQRIGGQLVITLTLACNSVLMVTAPVMARVSPYLLLANQILIGLTMVRLVIIQ